MAVQPGLCLTRSENPEDRFSHNEALILNTDCPSWVELKQDPNNDRIITFNDGYWHFLRAKQVGGTGYIYLDDIHEGLQTILWACGACWFLEVQL